MFTRNNRLNLFLGRLSWVVATVALLFFMDLQSPYWLVREGLLWLFLLSCFGLVVSFPSWFGVQSAIEMRKNALKDMNSRQKPKKKSSKEES